MPQRRWWLALTVALALVLGGPKLGYANQDRPLVLGERVNGRLENAVSVDNYRFQGRAGMIIRVRFTAEAGLKPAARLEVDNREVWFGGAPGSNVVDSGNLTLDSNNQYLLQVRSANGRGGGYVLETASSDQSFGVSGAGVLTPGVPVNGWLSGPTTGQRYRFSAQAGQTLLLRVRSGEGLTPRLTVQAPDGLLLWSGRASGPNQELNLPPLILRLDGPYQVYLTTAGASGGTYELSMNLINERKLRSVAAPFKASSENDLPPLRLVQRARFAHAFTVDGRVVLVAQGFQESPERIYLTLKDLEGEHAGRVRELVLYDGAAYLRQDAEPTWQRVSPGVVSALMPTADLLLLFDGPLTRLGDLMLNDLPAEHYQIWGTSSARSTGQPGFVKVDFFIDAQSRYLRQLQLEASTARLDGNLLLRGIAINFFDYNDPTLVVRPPN